MYFAKPITNNLKKFISSLKTKKSREENKLFLVEGEKLCEELLNSTFTAEFLVVRSSHSQNTETLSQKFFHKNVPVYIAHKQQFEGLCETVTPQDIIAVARMEEKQTVILDNFIALDGISDPGNLGTIIRTADWFGFNTIVLGENCADKFNSKTVRSSMGSLFRMNIVAVDNLAGYLRNLAEIYEIFGATLSAVKKLPEIKPGKKFGIVFGSEAHGISSEVRSCLTEEFVISGSGNAESLNVAVSVGISLYYFSNFIQ